MPEVAVTAAEKQVVFDNQRGDPKIIRRDWRSLRSELTVQLRVASRCSLAGIKRTHPWFAEKSVQSFLVFYAAGTGGEACA